MSDYLSSTVTDPATLSALRDEWTELLLDSEQTNVFLSWEWMTTWMERQRSWEPLVLLLRRPEGTLVGLAPLCRRRWRYPFALRAVGFMGTGVGADHLAFLSRRGLEQEVYPALTRSLFSSFPPDVLEFPRLDEGFAASLRELIAGAGSDYAHVSSVADLCSFITLPDSSEAYLRNMHQRAEFGRRWRRLQEQGDVRIQRVETRTELDEGWQALLRLHQSRRQAVGGRSAFLAPASRAFHERFVRRAFERGWVRLYLLRVNGTCVAAEYCLHVGTRVVGFQGGFDMQWGRYWVRSILTAHSIRTAIEEGAAVYDLTRGAEQYKQQRWGAATSRDVTLAVWKRRPRVRAARALRAWGQRVVDRVRRRATGQPAGQAELAGHA